MRLWTLHPRYLDSRGLVALWREALLARAVLRGQTRGYRSHPQLDRFQARRAPQAAIEAYLAGVHAESLARGYAFDASKLAAKRSRLRMQATRGQLEYEWGHLLAKLRARSPECYRQWHTLAAPEPHPLFDIVAGPMASWERPIAPA
jgi:hypothetical protein